jgi:hypothetical protein
MSRQFLSRDPITGLTHYFHPSDDGNTFGIESVADVTEIIDDNKRILNGENAKARKWGEMDRIASIPLHIYMDLDAKGIINDEKKFKAWLNDPENRYFRTKGGIV